MLRFLIFACAVSAIHACGVPVIQPNEMSVNIVGGNDAKPNSWPWMVEVIIDDGHHCGGTLINNNWIVSAAHCFRKDPDLNRLTFSVGGHVSADSPIGLSEETRQTFRATKFIRHADFTFLGKSSDIALIKIEGANFNEYVQPACLAIRRPEDNTPAYATGWGDQYTRLHDEDLQQVMVPIVNQLVCDTAYSGKIDHTMICAGYAAGGKDACQGDSGGPLVVKDEFGRWTLVGIISWGEECAKPGVYGVYSSVADLYNWIQTNMASN